MRIRSARPEDAEGVAVLCRQLGYPASSEDVRWRLDRIQRDDHHAVYVAEADGHVVGWIHVYVSRLVELDPHAEIGGLVVDEGGRGQGVGRLLLQHAEGWARDQGLEMVRVRSNVVREDAHAFYQALGYTIQATSLLFRKAL